jgi:hypothetical protein
MEAYYEMDLKKNKVDLIHLTLDTVQLPALVDMIISLWVPQNACNFMSG